MLERQDIGQHLKYSSQGTFKKYSESALEDLVLSLSHRLASIETSLNSKIDRTQCMMILQTKANFSQIKKITEDLNIKLEKDRKNTQEKMMEQQRQNIETIQKFKQKLKGKKKEVKRGSQQKLVYALKPQQLYLQSNETMFGIVVDEITSLKQAQHSLQKTLQQRQRVTLNLNNEVCQKIQNLQRQISISLKFIKQNKKISELEDNSNLWSNYQQKSEKQSRIKQSRSNGFQKTQTNKIISLDSHQLAHVTRSIESLQKDMSNKINIKDVLPIIKKNLHPVTQMIDEIKNYTEQAIQSTKKILVNQSEINQQLCTVSKMGWWQSFEQRDGYAVWNKEIANLVPQNYIWQKNSNQILIAQQGTYLIKILAIMDGAPQFILVSGQQVEVLGESLLKLQKNTSIVVPSAGGQMFISIQRI